MKNKHETLKRVTIENRILLLLHSRMGQEDLLTVELILTQGGMAAEFQIRRNNITRAISELTSNDLIFSRTKHIKGKDRRRKAYFLSEKGIEETDRLIINLSKRYIHVRSDDEGRVEWTLDRTISEVSSRLHRKVTPYEMISKMISGIELDLGRISDEGERDTLSGTPKIDGFFGRDEETDLIMSMLGKGVDLISIISIAGQGKTTLVSNIVRTMDIDAVWVELNPWISTDLVLDEIENSIPGNSVQYSKGDIYHRSKRISRRFGSSSKVLILDDVHRCSRDMSNGIKVLRDLSKSDRWTLILISRSRPDLYTRTEAMSSDRILEVQLEGLPREQSFSLMEFLEVPEAGKERIFEVTAGNPLAINLCSLNPNADPTEISVSFENYLEDNVLKEITKNERSALELISCFDIPVEKQSLLDDLAISRESLDKLISRSLVRIYPDNSIDVHDSIKEGIRSLLSENGTKKLLRRIRDYHMDRSRDVDMVQYLIISLELGDTELVKQGLIEHGEYLLGKGFVSVAEMALELDNEGLDTQDSVRMNVLRYDSASALGDNDQAMSNLREAGKLAEEIVKVSNDQSSLELMTMVLNRFAERALKGGMHREVIKRLKKGLKIARESGAKDQEARLISNIGCAYLDLGEPGMATGFFNDALDLFLQIDDQRGEVISRLNLGRSRSMTMDLSGALKQYLECIRSAHKADMTRIVAQANFRVGRLYWFVGDPDEAINYYSEAAVGYVKEGDIEYSLMILNELIEPCLDLDRMGRLRESIDKMYRAYKGRGWSYIKYRLGLEKDTYHPDEQFFFIISRSIDGKEVDDKQKKEIERIMGAGKELGKNDMRPEILRKILLRKDANQRADVKRLIK